MLRTILPDAAQRGIKIISNAGGMNCVSCGQAIAALVEELGLDLKVAVVTSDDILDQADRLRAAGIREMFNVKAMPEYWIYRST